MVVAPVGGFSQPLGTLAQFLLRRPASGSELSIMELLTVTEVAERVRVSPELVRRWLRQGRLRGVRLGGTRLGWRIPEAELDRFLVAAGLCTERDHAGQPHAGV